MGIESFSGIRGPVTVGQQSAGSGGEVPSGSLAGRTATPILLSKIVNEADQNKFYSDSAVSGVVGRVMQFVRELFSCIMDSSKDYSMKQTLKAIANHFEKLEKSGVGNATRGDVTLDQDLGDYGFNNLSGDVKGLIDKIQDLSIKLKGKISDNETSQQLEQKMATDAKLEKDTMAAAKAAKAQAAIDLSARGEECFVRVTSQFNSNVKYTLTDVHMNDTVGEVRLKLANKMGGRDLKQIEICDSRGNVIDNDNAKISNYGGRRDFSDHDNEADFQFRFKLP